MKMIMTTSSKKMTEKVMEKTAKHTQTQVIHNICVPNGFTFVIKAFLYYFLRCKTEKKERKKNDTRIVNGKRRWKCKFVIAALLLLMEHLFCFVLFNFTEYIQKKFRPLIIFLLEMFHSTKKNKWHFWNNVCFLPLTLFITHILFSLTLLVPSERYREKKDVLDNEREIEIIKILRILKCLFLIHDFGKMTIIISLYIIWWKEKKTLSRSSRISVSHKHLFEEISR